MILEMSAPVHVGNLVKSLLKEKHMKQNSLIPYMPKNKSNISKLLNKEDWHLSEIIAAGECLKLPLLDYLAPKVSADGVFVEGSPIYKISQVVKQMQECLEKLKEEKARREQSEELNKLYREKVRQLEIENHSLKTGNKTK